VLGRSLFDGTGSSLRLAFSWATGSCLGFTAAKNEASRVFSDLFLFLLLGTIIGARLGHVFFYQPDYYLAHPWEVPMVWQGGLASHGGFAGVIIAIYLYRKKHPDMSFMEIADRISIPCLLAATLIRIGNFFNSEIIGTPSNLPWAIVFASIDNVPRHPAMLYEAAAYFIVFVALYLSRTGRPQSFNFRGELSA
jgi:phosphatidylglycerol---prolipoprotein diacylglyceryl transferase